MWAASSKRCVPTSRDPVNAIIRTLGCATSASPTAPPGPAITFSTPGGRPASVSASAIAWAVATESLAGFITTVLPQTIAPSAIPAGMARGKFHGEMTATTPRGRYRYSLISPGIGGSGRPGAYRRISRA